MTALGIQTDFIGYMMGHAISTYHDVEMNGVEFLRGEYAKAMLNIRSKTDSNKMAIVLDFLKSMNLNPGEILSKEAQGNAAPNPCCQSTSAFGARTNRHNDASVNAEAKRRNYH